MSKNTLYRQYRPTKFSDVVGQELVVKILKNIAVSNKSGGAYIFAGNKGSGKTSLARIFANSLNCLHLSADGEVCSECEICQEFLHGNSTNIIELDAASNNGVDEIRKINDNVYFLPQKGKKKIYLIDEAHMLSNSAWNALLKTIEEPPEHVVFIFATTEVHKIPATIISRCMCFRFNKIQPEKIFARLDHICQKEEIKCEKTSLQKIVQLANGSVRDALSILEQLSLYTNKDIKQEDIYQIYGLVSDQQIQEFLNLLLNKQSGPLLATLDNYFSAGIDFGDLSKRIIQVLIDHLIYQKTKDTDLISPENKEYVKSLSNDRAGVFLSLLKVWQTAYEKSFLPGDLFIVMQQTIMSSLDLLDHPITDKTDLRDTVSSDKPKETFHKDLLCDVGNPFTNKEQVAKDPTLSNVSSLNSSSIEAEGAKGETKIEKTNAVLDSLKKPQDNSLQDISPQACEAPNFTTTEIHCHLPETNFQKTDEFDLFYKIFFNEIKERTKQWQEKLEKIKANKDHPLFKYFFSAQKILAASENGTIVVFSNLLDAKILNDAVRSTTFIDLILQEFQKKIFFVAFTVDQINAKKQEILARMKEKQHYDDVDITGLDQTRQAPKDDVQSAFDVLINKNTE